MKGSNRCTTVSPTPFPAHPYSCVGDNPRLGFYRIVAGYPPVFAFTLFYPQVDFVSPVVLDSCFLTPCKMRNLYVEPMMTVQIENSKLKRNAQALTKQVDRFRLKIDPMQQAGRDMKQQLELQRCNYEDRLAKDRTDMKQQLELLEFQRCHHEDRLAENRTERAQLFQTMTQAGNLRQNSEALLTTKAENQRQHYEALLTEARVNRDYAVESDRQSALIVRTLLLRASENTGPTLKGNSDRSPAYTNLPLTFVGSATRAEACRSAIAADSSPSTSFICDHGKMMRRLGNPQHSMVGDFPIKGKPGLVMAVKRSPNPSHEITILRSFLVAEFRPLSIPVLQYVAEDESEFGIWPVGEPLVASNLENKFQAQTVLTDVLDALVWLHKLGIVHRDVRSENVLVTKNGYGILIDFDADCDYRRTRACLWRGGYICCPREHLRHLVNREQVDPSPGWNITTLYCPSPSDDWGSWVLLVNCLLFPRSLAGFQSNLVGTASEESRRLLHLWDSLEASQVWAPFVKAARDANVGKLRELPSIFTWL